MKTCTVFIKQSILIAIWVVAAICYPSNNILQWGLLSIIVLNMALLLYTIKTDLNNKTLYLEALNKEIKECEEKLEFIDKEMKSMKEMIPKTEKEAKSSKHAN